MPKNQAKGDGNEGQNHTNFGSITGSGLAFLQLLKDPANILIHKHCPEPDYSLRPAEGSNPVMSWLPMNLAAP